ncbi:hypothetical protein ABSY27_09635 [Escherichia coli]|nr:MULTISPECIES: hypothetical protein [Enterobacterales]MBU3425559.1 hypothetical protein [Escherichia coli]MBV5182347.1 hypothetical protein [Escherichia coli]MBW7037747.1 hypothetical protein [Escherichia coli]MBY8415339.1 hypothetical protein [Escherichia coli]MBZ5872645.1 hypothetical protein [Escherichia coli]
MRLSANRQGNTCAECSVNA